MADAIHDAIMQVIERSTYGAADPNLSHSARGGGAGAGSRGNRGRPGYPVPDILKREEIKKHDGTFFALEVPYDVGKKIALKNTSRHFAKIYNEDRNNKENERKWIEAFNKYSEYIRLKNEN